jgi:putative methionine-R-sulfoxide reductase with GAF domain
MDGTISGTGAGHRFTTLAPMAGDDLVAAVAAVATTDGGPAERAGRIAAAIREYGGHRWVGVYEVTDTEIALLGYAGSGPPAYPRFPRTQGISASAVATGRTVVVDDVRADPRYLTAFGSTRSEMIVPVLVGGGAAVVGTIDLESDRTAAFGDAERELVERCAGAVVPLFRGAA